MIFKMPYKYRLVQPLRAVIILSLVFAAMQSTTVRAEDKPAEDKPARVKLQLHPAAEPVPALRYQLLPSFIDSTRGNAALGYWRMVGHWKNAGSEELLEKLGEWREMPLEKLPREEIHRVLDQKRQVLEGLTRAARCDTCEWQLPVRESFNPFEILLPELQQLRSMTYLLAVKARLEIAEGRFDDAVQTLQSGFAMAGHIAEGPVLINALVGKSVAGVMTKRVEELISQPGSPNMYWALTMLPSPTISFHKALAVEMNLLEMFFPELREIETAPGTTRQWQGILDRICDKGRTSFWMPEAGETQSRLAIMALVAIEYPRAKKALIASGLTAETVEAMPVAQVVALHTVGEYREIRDNLFKWFGLPYWQAREGLKAMDQQFRSARKQGVGNALVAMLLPALSRCKLAEAQGERYIAMLRTIEALRLHASANNGRLPSRLGEISIVPLPIDPVTGKPFGYDLKGDTAVIDAPAPSGMSGKAYHKIYEIQIINTEKK